jgi:hypothetical protein
MRRQVALITTLITTGFAAMGHDYPAFEEYAAKDNLGGYPKAALRYISQNHDSVWAARVALDLLVVGELADGDALSIRSKNILCFSYPESPQTRYVLTTFEDAKAFRKFVQPTIEKIVDSPVVVDHQNACKLIHVAAMRFGEELFKDVDFAIQACAFAETTADDALASLIRQKHLSKIGADGRRYELAQLCLDKAVTPEERVLQLGGLSQDGITRRVKKLYLAQLSEAERASAPIMLLRAHEAALAKEYDTALRLLGQLPGELAHKLETRLLHAYCQLAIRSDAAALALLEEVEGDDELAEYARNYRKGIAELASRKRAMAEAIKVLSDSMLSSPLTAIEASAKYTSDGGVPLSLYIGLQPDRNTLELHVSRDSERLLAYRTTADSSQLLFGQDKRILRYGKGGPIPVPSIELKRTLDGGFQFNCGAKMTSSMEEATEAGSRIVESPYLTTLRGIEQLLDHAARRSSILSEPRREGDQITWALCGRSLADGDFSELEITSNGPDKLTGIRFNDTLKVFDIRYSDEDGASLSPPAWPEVPVEERETIGMEEMMRVMQLVTTVMGG